MAVATLDQALVLRLACGIAGSGSHWMRNRLDPTSTLQRLPKSPSFLSVNDSLPTCAAEACQQPELCPLNRVKAGTEVRIKQLATPPEISHRLREMGLCEEQQIRLVSRHVNVICQVCNARLGISKQLAESILVETLPPSTRQVLPVA